MSGVKNIALSFSCAKTFRFKLNMLSEAYLCYLLNLLVNFLNFLGVYFIMIGVNNTHSSFDRNGKRERMGILIVVFLY